MLIDPYQKDATCIIGKHRLVIVRQAKNPVIEGLVNNLFKIYFLCPL